MQPAAAAPRPTIAGTGDGADFFDQVERKTREAVNREKIIESIRQDLVSRHREMRPRGRDGSHSVTGEWLGQ